MEGNPYRQIVDAVNEQIQRQKMPAAVMGVVNTVFPLTVAVENIVLSSASGLLISSELLPRTRKSNITNPEKAIETEAEGALGGKLTVLPEKLAAEVVIEEQEGSLKVGDRVLLITSDQNIYTVVCKVVSA